MRYRNEIAVVALSIGAILWAPLSVADDQQGLRINGDLGGPPTNVPAPATVALFGLGAGLLLLKRRK